MNHNFKIKRNITLLKWFNFFEDFRLYAPIAIIYFAEISGSYAFGMSVFSVIYLSQSLLEVPTGILSDRHLQRKGSMICGAVAGFFSLIFYTFANDYSFLIIGAAFEGLARSFYSGTDKALLYETLQETGEDKDYDDCQGKVSSMFQAAIFCASLLGAAAVWHSYKLAFLLSVIPKFCQIITSCFFVEPESHSHKFETNVLAHTKEAIKSFHQNKKLKWFTIASIVSFSFGEASYQFQAAFIKNIIPDWAINLIKSLCNLGAVFSFWFAGSIINKFGYFKIFVQGTALSGIINVAAVLINNIVSPFLLALPSLLFGTTLIAENSIMQKEFSDKQRATMGSMVSLLGSAFFAVVSVIVGFFADIYGAMPTLLVCILIPKIIVLPIYGIILRKQPK
ncbi:MAG: MFS transporter [Alphaproteobacteria bacterium]